MSALKRDSLLAAANGHLAVALRDHVKAHAEDRPGVYRMVGPGGDIVYVGKSIKLRTRLLSYFRADRTEKATEVISAARRVEWEYVPSEFAALLHELRMIQRHRPLFNVHHKLDDGTYCFIRVTREDAPRVLISTQVLDDGSTYYGPYRGRQMVRNLVKEVCDLLQLRDCPPSTPLRYADQIDLFNFDATPRCVRADLMKCLAPCAGRCTRFEYHDRVREAKRFLEGDFNQPLQLLHDRMTQAAERMQFEYAAHLRDRAYRLEGARAELTELRGTIDSLSFIYTVPGHRGDDRVYIIRRGSIRAELPLPRSAAEEKQLLETSAKVFSRRERGPATVDPNTVGEILLISRWFRMRPDELSRTVAAETLLS